MRGVWDPLEGHIGGQHGQEIRDRYTGIVQLGSLVLALWPDVEGRFGYQVVDEALRANQRNGKRKSLNGDLFIALGVDCFNFVFGSGDFFQQNPKVEVGGEDAQCVEDEPSGMGAVDFHGGPGGKLLKEEKLAIWKHDVVKPPKLSQFNGDFE